MNMNTYQFIAILLIKTYVLVFSISLATCSIEEMQNLVPNQRDNPISASLAQAGLLQRSSAPINIPNSNLTNSISGKYFVL